MENGLIDTGIDSANMTIRSVARFPGNRAASATWRTRSGAKPINRAHVASAATGSSANTTRLSCRSIPTSGPSPSHCPNSVCDHEVNACRSADIEDALVNAMPMQKVLGPAILQAWHHTEHVFQAQRHARPVMCFDLRHRHGEIGCQDSTRQPKRPKTTVAG